jgi:hypothetical protein
MFNTFLGSDAEPWYGWMFVGLAIFIVCPAWSMGEISNLTGWKFSWRHIIWLEVIFIGIMVVTTILLKRAYPEMPWFQPLTGIALVAFIRVVFWVMHQLFPSEFDDD